MPTAQDVFDQSVRPLPAAEQLRLAALILQGLAQDARVVDRHDAWSAQDERDLTSFSLRYAERQYPEDQELV